MSERNAGDPLTRAQIDEIVDKLTMGDIQAGMATSENEKAWAGIAFARGAKRSGLVNGGDPLDAVSLADVPYLGKRIKALLSAANPKSESTEG